MKDQTRIFVK